jgi:hypothetical protein
MLHARSRDGAANPVTGTVPGPNSTGASPSAPSGGGSGSGGT